MEKRWLEHAYLNSPSPLPNNVCRLSLLSMHRKRTLTRHSRDTWSWRHEPRTKVRNIKVGGVCGMCHSVHPASSSYPATLHPIAYLDKYSRNNRDGWEKWRWRKALRAYARVIPRLSPFFDVEGVVLEYSMTIAPDD